MEGRKRRRRRGIFYKNDKVMKERTEGKAVPLRTLKRNDN